MIAPPLKIVIEPTAICNLRCIYCPTGQGMLNRTKYMSWELFERIADEIEPFARHVYLAYMGEPLLHPRFPDMIDRIKEFATIDVATNGTLVTEGLAKALDRADALSVHFSGLDSETFAAIHGVDLLDDAMRGLEILAGSCGKRLNWTWMALSLNEHQNEKAAEIGAQLGISQMPKSVVLGRDQRATLKPSDLAPWRYTDRGTTLYDRSACNEFWEVGYILTNGVVVTCGYDYAGLWPMGNAYNKPFLDIWNGEAYNRLRENHMAGKTNQMCRLVCGHM